MGIRKFLFLVLMVCSLVITLPGLSGAETPITLSQGNGNNPLYKQIKCEDGTETFGSEGFIYSSHGNMYIGGWILKHALNTTINDIAYTPPATVVYVGNGGKIFRSLDCGKTIEEVTSPTSANLKSIQNPTSGSQVMFRAEGEGGTIIESNNGTDWQLATPENPPTFNINGADFKGSSGMLVGDNGNYAATKDGGSSYSLGTTGSSANLYGVATDGTNVVAVGGSGGIFRDNLWFKRAGTNLMAATGSVTWASVSSGTYYDLNSIVFGNNLFVIVGNGGMILTSPNGIAWTKRTSPTTNNLFGVSYDSTSNTFTAVGQGGAWVTSPDGITWTSMLQGTSNTMLGVTYANNVFAAVGAAGTILTSPDGAAWTQRTSGTTDALTGIAFGNNGFVAVGGGSSGLVLTSSDGITWTNRGSKAAAVLADIVYGNGLFAAGGMSGALVTSPDGVNWTTRSSGITGKITCVAYGNGLFAAVAETEGNYTAPSGVILTSTDGITWSKKTFADYHFYGVAYGNGLFVAVGGDKNSQGALLTSPDGATWTPRTSGTNNLLVGAVYADGIFMVVGQNGITVTSPDGITWTARNSVTKNYLYRAAYGNTAFVAVGYIGTIVRSEGCYSILSTYNLSLHAPYLTFNGQAYWADFYYDLGLDFILYNAGLISDAGSYSSCAPSTLSAEGKLSMPQLNYNGLPLWADFQYTSGLTFTLTEVGAK